MVSAQATASARAIAAAAPKPATCLPETSLLKWRTATSPPMVSPFLGHMTHMAVMGMSHDFFLSYAWEPFSNVSPSQSELQYQHVEVSP